jgi:glycosyltransferase involved in cell wall biosynthesis
LQQNTLCIRRSGEGEEKELRILHLTYQGNPAGSTKSLIYLTKGLAQRGHKVFLGVRPESLLYNVLRGSDVEVIPFTFKKRVDFKLAKEISNFVEEKRVDVVNAHSSIDRWSVILAKKFFGMKAKVIFTRRQMPRSSSIENKLYSAFVDGIIAVSNAVKEALIKEGTASSLIRVIQNGVPWENLMRSFKNVRKERLDELRERFNIEGEDCVLGVVARMKQQHILLKALKYIKQPVKVLFIGIQPNHKIKKLCAELPPHHKIFFLGHIDDVTPYYHLFTLSILPSVIEGLSQTILESLTFGIPVICSDAGGNPEVIKSGKWGFLFPPEDAQFLARCIEILLNDERLRNDFKSMGREVVRRSFSIERTVNLTEELYQEILMRGK